MMFAFLKQLRFIFTRSGPLVSLSKHLADIENLQFLIVLVWKQRQDA